MAERQALDDLLAAINGNPNNEQGAAFPNVSPVPSAQISQFSGQVADPTAANALIARTRQVPARRQAGGQLTGAGRVPSAQQVPGFHHGRAALAATSSKENNLIELENLLGNRPSSSSATRPANAGTQQMFAQQSASGAASSRHLQLGGAYAAGAVNPNIAAGLSRQQLANAKAIQRQRAASAANATRQPAPMQPNSASQIPREGLPAEMAAGMARNAAASNAARSQAQRTSNGAVAATQRQGINRNPQSGQGRNSQNRSITQEQIIVGHFCRHAIKTLGRVMENNPRAARAEAQLKDHIKTVWAKWVRQLVTRTQLLESVANCVRSSCDAAAGIDVIREFKTWYEREYERQKQRTSMDPTEQAKWQALAQRRTSSQNSMTVMRPQTSTVPANAVNRGSAAIRSPAGNRTLLTKAQEAQLVSNTGGKRLANKTIPGKQAAAGRAVAGKTLAGRGAGRGVAGKSVGGKSVPRPQSTGKITNPIIGRGQPIPRASVAGRGTAGGKVPMISRSVGVGKSPAIGRGSPLGQVTTMVNAGIANESVVSGKGLLSNKSPATSKAKAPRKPIAKGPVKPATKVSPKATGARPKPPPANPAAFVNVQGVPGMVGSVVGKRPLDQSGGLPQGPLTKKTKPPPVVSKGPAARKKPLGLSGSLSVHKGKPPPARPDMFKGRQPKRPGQPPPVGHTANAMSKGLVPGQATTGQPPVKKPRRTGDGMDELSVVNNIVDIEDEEDKLGIDAGGDAPEVQEVFDYGADMLLSGPRLRAKMQTITKRFGLDGHFRKEIMDMVSLAVRERLAEIFESLREIASIRIDRDKEYWKTEPTGPNVYDRLMRIRQDEERSLQVAAEMRVKRRKEQMEQEAKKLAGENASTDKKTKDASAAAEAERKEKLALEKKRKESSSQRDALSALVRSTDARRKKPSTSKGLAPLEQLGKKGLPPIPKLVGAGGVVSAGSSSKDGKTPDALEKLNTLGPLVKLGRANDPRNMEPQPAAKKDVKRRLTLRDCLFLMEKGPNTRKSSILYKWYARLGTRDEK